MICCGEEMRHTKLGYFLCEKCQNQVEDELGLIKRTLEEHPGANAIDLMRLPNLPSNTILKYLDDGVLTPIKRKKNIRGYYNPQAASRPKWHIHID